MTNAEFIRLVSEIRNGSREAGNKLYEEIYPIAVNCAGRFWSSFSTDDRKDFAMAAMGKLMLPHNLEKAVNSQSPVGYAIVLIKRSVIDSQRELNKGFKTNSLTQVDDNGEFTIVKENRNLSSHEPDPSEEADFKGKMKKMHFMVRMHNIKYLKFYIAFVEEGKSPEIVAEEFGIALGNARTMQTRIKILMEEIFRRLGK